MAQRFGGKFSPQGESKGTSTPSTPPSGAYRDARRTRAGGRVNLLFLAPLPLIWQAFGNGPQALALNLAALAALLLAAWLTREGLLAQEAYEARKVARRPAIPRKMLGSALTGIGLAVASFAAKGTLVEPVIYGLIGAALHLAAFGADPMKNKGMEGVDEFQTDRVARMVDKAEEHLAAMSDAIKRAHDREAETRLARFQTHVRDLLRTVENDPRDLTAARKFMGIYLMGARDATVKFADIQSRSPDAQARADYFSLLDDLEASFKGKTKTLLLDDRTDLTVEIDVLRDRLKREGIHLAAPEQ
ncbi:5-bromo-4-chloroindolyl phosphate hydrolysis family protein [Rhodalgimonas zhirmunskyi]|uniref:5-bromo-4-chloroindolyl phosphate hydrolysis family protein n=1 Tax=Rhodalgimonas zhirmunskyi TaxID=2964767 RepID=A0AAJ1U8M7_9RHOB|nr:5-bromo-4-chloroindolyl phosphate hydrolysis family protein [Rhodoalgimonas zhirmunskyi]MDQ2094979.1 5-bromo-4-chloroindolyl phosphate hydrolysis family protein [Rhodoalgimonas zhirmunskyi]